MVVFHPEGVTLEDVGRGTEQDVSIVFPFPRSERVSLFRSMGKPLGPLLPHVISTPASPELVRVSHPDS